MSFIFCCLASGACPWRSYAHVLLKFWHCMANHADLVVNGNFVELPLMSDTEVVRTTVSIDCETNEKIGTAVKHYGPYIV